MLETASTLTSRDHLNEEQAWSKAAWSSFATVFGHGHSHGRGHGLTVCPGLPASWRENVTRVSGWVRSSGNRNSMHAFSAYWMLKGVLSEKYVNDLHHTLSHLKWQAWPVCCCFARIFAYVAVQ